MSFKKRIYMGFIKISLMEIIDKIAFNVWKLPTSKNRVNVTVHLRIENVILEEVSIGGHF